MDEVRDALGGRGRKRGERVAIRLMVPPDVKDAVVAAANESGLPIMDWVTLALARRLGVPDPSYIQVPDGTPPPDELDLGLPNRRERPRMSA